MRILVTNDDGIEAEGINLLTELAYQLSDDIWVCAPHGQQSCASHALTMGRPLRVYDQGEKRFSVDGTPGDSVLLAINKLMPERPDLVLSGINHGHNVGHDVTYSGTVAGAMEGTLLGIRSIAFSAGMSEIVSGKWTFEWDVPKKFLVKIAQDLLTLDWPQLTLMNVNFPHAPVSDITGIRLAHHMDAKMKDEVIERHDRWGRPYYWVGHSTRHETIAHDSDVAAVKDKAIAITPIKIDMTDYNMLKTMTESLKDSFSSLTA